MQLVKKQKHWLSKELLNQIQRQKDNTISFL